MNSPPDSTISPSPRAAATPRVVFALMLAVFAAVLLWTGAGAIREGRYVSTVTVERSVGCGVGVSAEEMFTDVYTGAAARRIAAGLASFGLLLGVWALGIVVHGSRQPGPRAGPFSKVALALLVTGTVLLCPPWRVVDSRMVLFFWISVVVWIAGLLVVRRRTAGQRKALILVLFVATLAAELVVPLRSSGGFMCGLMAALLGMVHAVYAYSPWRQALLALGRPERTPPEMP
jgi:hypothetical protein